MSMFNQRFKELKEEKGVMLKDLAAALGYTSSKLSYYLNSNNAEPPYDTLIKIAEYFNVSIDYLLGISNYKNKNQEFSSRLIDAYRGTSDDEVSIALVDFEYFLKELYINQEDRGFEHSFDRIILLRRALDTYLDYCEHVEWSDPEAYDDVIDLGYETICYINEFTNDLVDEINSKFAFIYQDSETSIETKSKLLEKCYYDVTPSKEIQKRISHTLQLYLYKKYNIKADTDN